MIEYAKSYAKVGLRVFPVASVDDEGRCTCRQEGCSNAGKHPLNGPGGFRSATSSAEKIEVWWGRHPQANIGYATGIPYLVIDIDGDEGEASWRRLTQGADVDTLQVETGSGGRHLYFRLPPAITDLTGSVKARPAPGLDVRAGNGYVLMPPSRHKSGRRYAWRRICPALPIPAWLYHVVRKERHVTPHSAPRFRPRTSAYGHAVLAACAERVRRSGEGERNIVLAREAFIIGQYVAGGEIDPYGIEEYLVDCCPDPDRQKTERTCKGQLLEGASYPKSKGV